MARRDHRDRRRLSDPGALRSERARVTSTRESLLRPLLAGLAIQPNLDQQVSLMSRTLISRPNVEKLVRMADLDLARGTAADREELIDSISKTSSWKATSRRTCTSSAIATRIPNQAKKVVQSLLTIFVESSLGDKRQDTQTAVKFLDDQIKNYEQNLQAAENRIKDFKLKYMGLSSQSQGQDYFGACRELDDAIEAARVELQSAEQARDSYKKELAGEEPVFLPEPTESRTREAVPETRCAARCV